MGVPAPIGAAAKKSAPRIMLLPRASVAIPISVLLASTILSFLVLDGLVFAENRYHLSVLSFSLLAPQTWAFLALEESRSEATAAHARTEHVFRALATLLKKRRLVGYALAGALNGAMLFTYISASADLIMGTYGISPLHFGWLFALNAAALIGAAQVNRTLLRRWSSDRILSRACLVALAAAGVFVFFAFTGTTAATAAHHATTGGHR